jgi:predicted transposase YbfD/YdcC
MGQRLGDYGQQLACKGEAGTVITSTGKRLQGQSIDGKELRGVRAHGRPLSLLSLVQHGNGIALAQVEVAEKSNEIPAAPMLLAERDLTNTVITADALHTQRDLARQIIEQNGHYLMVVKENQGALYQAIELLFRQPPWLPSEQAAHYRTCQTTNKGHGRREIRTLETSTALSGYLDWPGAQQVMRRHCKRVIVKTGEVSNKTTYAITSLPAAVVGAADLASLWRSHWTIENCTHYVLDVTMGEDGCQVHTGNAPQALSLLRKALLALLRTHGWSNVADAIRHYGASVHRALMLIGALPT